MYIDLYLYTLSPLGLLKAYLKISKQVKSSRHKQGTWVDIKRPNSGSDEPGNASQECKPIRRAETGMWPKYRVRGSMDI